MLFTLFLYFIKPLSFSELQPFTLKDFSSEDTFLVYIYYSKPNYECPLCVAFNNKISQLPITIKKINFYESPYTASHFYQFMFPSFVIRNRKKSFVLDVSKMEELFEIVETESWKGSKPIHWVLEYNSVVTKVFSAISCVVYYVIEYLSYYIDKTPGYVINGLISFIIAYLVYSIIEIICKKKEKIE